MPIARPSDDGRIDLRAGRGHAGGTLLVVFVIVLFAFPLVVMVLASLRQPGLPPPQGIELVPDNPGVRAYTDAFMLVPLGRGVLNSAIVSAIAVPITIVTASCAALAVMLMDGWQRQLLIRALFLLAMVPVTAVWIPRFVLFGALDLVGTYAPLVAPALMGGSPLFVLLYVLAFRRIPADLFDAARMEGIGPVGIWWHIALPLARPTTAAIALLSLALFWSNFIDPLLYLNSEADLTAPLMLQHLELLGPTNWPVFLAGCVVVTLPVVTAVLFAHRFLRINERGPGWLGR